MHKRYKTLAELKAAIDSGELRLDPQDRLVIDNDTTDLRINPTGGESAASEIKVFSMHPVNLLEEALDLLGIPHENA